MQRPHASDHVFTLAIRTRPTVPKITLGIHGKAFARELEELFREDEKVCKEVIAKEWAKRGPMHKLKDNFYYLWNEML